MNETSLSAKKQGKRGEHKKKETKAMHSGGCSRCYGMHLPTKTSHKDFQAFSQTQP